MTLVLSIITLFVLIVGVVLLITAAGCERISRAIDSLKHSPSARVTSAVMGVVMIVVTVGPQVHAAQMIIRSESTLPIVTPTLNPPPREATAKPTQVDPSRLHGQIHIIPGP